MKHVRFVAGFAAGCATVLIAATAINRQDQQGAEPPTEEDQMWADWMENYGTPAKEHEQLAVRVGDWNCTNEWYMAPGEPAQTSTGTANFEMWMDGRYVVGRYHSDMMGEAFDGASCTAYDRFQKKYISCWIDNMGTGIMVSEGKATDASGKVIEYVGESPSPGIGMAKYRIVEREVDNDTFIMEMYGPDMANPDSEFLTLKITYKRAN